MPPPDHEELEIGEEGAFSMWRSIGRATQPPTPVGLFNGRLEAGLYAELREEARAAAQARDLYISPAPDSPLEAITIGDIDVHKAYLGIHDDPEGAWGALVDRLRSLLGELTRFPRAALAVEVLEGGHRARLVHRGEEPLRLDLRGL